MYGPEDDNKRFRSHCNGNEQSSNDFNHGWTMTQVQKISQLL